MNDFGDYFLCYKQSLLLLALLFLMENSVASSLAHIFLDYGPSQWLAHTTAETHAV